MSAVPSNLAADEGHKTRYVLAQFLSESRQNSWVLNSNVSRIHDDQRLALVDCFEATDPSKHHDGGGRETGISTSRYW